MVSPQWPSAYVIRARELLTMTGWQDKPPLERHGAERIAERDAVLCGRIEDGAVTVRDGTIVHVGAFADRLEPELPVVLEAPLVMPAQVECHTHALFAGTRAREFGMRNAGIPYVEILEAGGGILSTVAATRAASDEVLLGSLVARLRDFARRGIGTVEVKTGYGLSTEEELRHLSLIARAAELVSPLRVHATFLGAHAVPAERRGQAERYVDEVVQEMLPAVVEQGIASACDVFCDRGAFSLAQSERILSAAREAGLDARIHAEELTHTGGAAMAARLGALSADHLDHAGDAEVEALVETGCVGVLLPGVTVFLDLAARPPARALIDRGGLVALSTDFNPGSAMTQDLGLMTTLGCTLLKMTPGEALWAVTAGSARAMGLGAVAGVLAPGRPADFSIFAAGDLAELPWHFGRDAARGLVLDGRPLWLDRWPGDGDCG